MQNITYSEFIDWVQWQNKTGFFTQHRLERSLAFIAMQFASATMKKKDGTPFTLDDFLLFAALKEDEEGTPDKVLELLSALAPKKKE